MKKSTSRLIFTFVAVFLLIVATTSMLGNIDSKVDDIVGNVGGGSGGGTTTTTKAPVTTKNSPYDCYHHGHDAYGYCYECGDYVGHNEVAESFDPQNDGTHYVILACSSDCGYGGSVGPETCTYRDGKCIFCDAINCLHSLHDMEGYCTTCGTVVEHTLEYNYISIEENNDRHAFQSTCTICGLTDEGLLAHRYNGDLTCDLCGYTAVVPE